MIIGVLTSNPQSDLKSDMWITCPYLSFFYETIHICIHYRKGLLDIFQWPLLSLCSVFQGWPLASVGFLILQLLVGFSQGRHWQETGQRKKSEFGVSDPPASPLLGHLSQRPQLMPGCPLLQLQLLSPGFVNPPSSGPFSRWRGHGLPSVARPRMFHHLLSSLTPKIQF